MMVSVKTLPLMIQSFTSYCWISNKPLARRGFRMCRVLQSISEPGLNKLGGKKKGEQERALCAFRVSCTSETSARVREVERG
jgi:hypothetical protein